MKEVVTIQELAQAYYDTDHRRYRSLIQVAGVSKNLERMLLQKGEQWRFAKGLEFQEEELELVRKILWQLDFQIVLEKRIYMI